MKHRRQASTCAMCEQWTLTQPGADVSQGKGHCTRFLNEINTAPRPAGYSEVSCVVFTKAGNAGERERFVARTEEKEKAAA